MVLFSTNLDEWAPWSRLSNPKTLEVPIDRSQSVNGVQIRYFATTWPSRFFVSPSMARELRRRVREFDLVHVHSLYLFPTLAATHYARRAGVPYIIRPHGTLDPFLRRRHRIRKGIYNLMIERRNLNQAAAIHYTAQDELELARPLGIRAPGVVVPLGVNPEEFASLPSRGTFRRLHPELEGKRLIVFLGRLTPKKGLDLLARAFALVAKACRDTRLVIAGPDDEGHGRLVRTWLKDAGVYEQTSIVGMLEGEAKRALLADTDVWVLPSYTENFGVAVIEAMACGLPVVITDKVGLHREVSAASAGLVVVCDAQELAAAIRRVLEDPVLPQQLSASAQELVRSQFTWDIAAKKLIRLYEVISASRGHGDRIAWQRAGR